MLLCAVVALSSAVCHRYVGGDVGLVATPHPDGSPCNNAVQCASYSCTNGACAAPTGGQVEIDGDCSGGQPCVGDAMCEDDICVATRAACAADGTPCLSDSDCCNEICTGSTCGFGDTGSTSSGGAGCGGDGTSCTSDSQCCSGACDMNAFTCSSACAPLNASCLSNDQCCSGTCDTGNEVCI